MTAATCNIDDAILPSQSPFAFSRKIAMKIARQVVLGTAIALTAFGQASAQDWPTRSVTVVVPIPAGVASDIIARVVFEQVGKQVGQTFVIENRSGAGGTIGANMVA
jgi:tripartite-type tricarboxylate transporter receptor subunit TctC